MLYWPTSIVVNDFLNNVIIGVVSIGGVCCCGRESCFGAIEIDGGGIHTEMALIN